jgi:hypothetical protein
MSPLGGTRTSSKHHVSNVNWRKVIKNFRSGYQLGATWEILIVELIANSVDAGSDEIWVELEGETPKILRVVDDGKGMTKGEFEEYHNLGSLTKRRGSGIGWAGIGAKLYIDRCQSITTETRSAKYSGASHWSFPKSEMAPIYDYIAPTGLLGGGQGTAVEVIVTDPKDCRQLTEEAMKQAILANYNYALRPIGHVVMKVNGERLVPFDPRENAENTTSVAVKLRSGERAEGMFGLLRDKAPPGFSMVSIVVHGKTVGEPYDFRQSARIREPEKIACYVRCDELTHITTTSKDNFNRKTSTWHEFERKVGKEFTDWLQAIGRYERAETDRALSKMAKEIQEDLNRVLKLPEIRGLNLDLYQNLTRRLAGIADAHGDALGSEVQGQQQVAGTIGGEGEGGGVPAPGDEPGASLEVSPEGATPAAQRERQVHSGLQIAYVDAPGQRERAWPDAGLRAIAINKANPAFRCADKLGNTPFYTIDACLQVLCDTMEDEDQRAQTLEKLFQGYLKIAESD